LSEAIVKALKLEPDMPQDTVRAMLGLPDETSYETIGTSTEHPWHGIIWTYKWEWRSGFFGDRTGRMLRVFFYQSQTNWFVNSWYWYDY
jgi:hypothetical protein